MCRRVRRWGMALAVTAALCVVLSTAARADEVQDQAILQTFQKGITLYQTGDYGGAKAAFDKVLAMEPGMEAALKMRDMAELGEFFEMTGTEQVAPEAHKLLDLLKRAGQERKRDVQDPDQLLEAFQAADLPSYGKARVDLAGHGPYAVPYVVGLLALDEPDGQRVVARAVSLLARLHPDACLPLARVLRNADNGLLKVRVAAVLGQIGEPRAVPALLATLADDASPSNLKDAAAEAVEAIAGVPVAELGTPAVEYAKLASAYFAGDKGMVGYTYGLSADIWQWDAAGADLAGRVVCEQVPAYLYYQRMATETALEGLAAAPGDADLQALLAASLARQLALCEYFATSDVSLAGVALDEATRQDAADRAAEFEAQVPVAVRMLGAPVMAQALEMTLEAYDGSASLFQVKTLGDKLAASGPASLCPASAEALVAALDSGDKDVRYNAAVALVSAAPTGELAPPDGVVSVLSAALQAAAERTALIVMDNFQMLNKLAGLLRDEGMATSECGVIVPQIEAVLALEPAVDVVFLSANVEAARFAGVLALLQGDARTKGAQLYVVLDPAGKPADVSAYEGIAAILSPDDIRTAKVAPIAAGVMAESRSAFTDEEGALVLKAARALCAVDPNNTSYPLAGVESALVKALSGYGDEVTAAAICALSRFGGDGCLKGLSAVVAGEGALELKVAAARAVAAVLSRSEQAAPAGTVETLKAALKTEEQVLREAAAEALSKAGLEDGELLSLLRTEGLGEQ